MGGAFQNSYTDHVTSDTSRALMWCTCVTLETVKEMHKQGDPLPPTDSLCFDSGLFFPSYIHHLMYVALLGGRRAPVFPDSEQVTFVLHLNSTTFILHALQWASHRRIAHRSSRYRSETQHGKSATPQRAPIPCHCVTHQLPASVTSEL